MNVSLSLPFIGAAGGRRRMRIWQRAFDTYPEQGEEGEAAAAGIDKKCCRARSPTHTTRRVRKRRRPSLSLSSAK